MLFDVINAHLARQRVAMDAQGICGFRQTAVALAEDPGDEAFFEFTDGVFELHAPVDHFVDKFLQTLGDHSNSCPVRRRKASTYFSRVLVTTSGGSEGTGGCLFHRICSR